MFINSPIKLIMMIVLYPLSAIGLLFCKGILYDLNYLNNRDLGFVGGEQGTVYEYLTNIWHWDVAIGVILLVYAIYILVNIIYIYTVGRSSN